MISLTIIVLALWLDICLGEPRHWHPLVFFGKFAFVIETRLLKAADNNHFQKMRYFGILAVILTLSPWLLLIWSLNDIDPLYLILIDIVILYLAIGLTSLKIHARHVLFALQAGDLVAARVAVSRIVSRNTTTLDETQIVKAATESVLENGNDALFGVIFWYLILGTFGVVLYRLVNTLDAMWGYRTARYFYFGWFTARLDDAMNWIPARLTALTYAIMGQFKSASKCWIKQAKYWESSNAGAVMASGAGALGLQLGGKACYSGQMKSRPILGQGREVVPIDIERALSLVIKGVILWLILIGLIVGGMAIV